MTNKEKLLLEEIAHLWEECSANYWDGFATGGLFVGLFLGAVWAYSTFF